MALYSRLFINIFCVAGLAFALDAKATDDDYLKMLEGEAEDLKLDQSGQLKVQADTGTEEKFTGQEWTWDGEILPSGLSLGEFSFFLKKNLYGSYAFFRKLNSIDQQTVYYHYTKASPAHLDAVRQDILDHLKK